MEFIEKYARVEGSEDEMENDKMEDKPGGDEVNELDLDFIDGETNFQDQEPTNYCLMNVTRDLKEAMANQAMAYDLDLIATDPGNFVSDFADEVSYEFDEFLGFQKRIQKFNEELKVFSRESKDSFYFSILYAIYCLCLRKRKILIFVRTKKNCVKF